MAVADTSFLIAFFDAQDTHHGDARARFEAADHVLVAAPVLAETLGVVKSRKGRQTAAACLEALMHMENVGWEEMCDIMATDRIIQEHPALSFVDGAVVELVSRVGGELLTYDKRQAAAAARRHP